MLGAPPRIAYEGRWLLPSVELACLAAEVCATTMSDLVRGGRDGRAFAVDLGGGAWRVHYARRPDGLFLPEADGCFERDRFLERDGPAFVEDPPRTPLGRIWYRRCEPVAPWLGATDRVLVVVRPDGDGAARARVEVTGPAALDRDERMAAILDAFDAAEQLALGLKLWRSGDRAEALRILDVLCRKHASGRSRTLDTLLARAWALQGRMLVDLDRLLDADRALRVARMLAPDSIELALLLADLRDRMARPERASEARAEALATLPPGSLRGRRLVLEERRRGGAGPVDLGHCLDEARAALRSGDATGGRHWAERARDLDPDEQEAILLLAEAHELAGQRRLARDLRVRAMHEGPPTAAQVLALSRDELALGNPDLALRLLLRHADRLADEPMTQAHVPEVLAALGTEGCLRVLRSEGFVREALPIVGEWLAAEPGARSRLLASVLASQAVESARRATLRGLVTEPLPGAPAERGTSGVRVRDPAAGPGR